MEHVDLIKTELERRRLKNPSYSLRAFARDLGIGVAPLSDFLAGKRALSPRSCTKVALRLQLGPREQELLSQARQKQEMGALPTKELLLKDDRFHSIADWKSLALLNMAKLPKCKGTKESIASRLGISEDEASLALKRLLRLKMIKKVKGGYIQRTLANFTTTEDIPSLAIQKCHRDLLELAKEALIETPVEKREFRAQVLTINPEQLPELRKMSIDFNRRFAQRAQKGSSRQVYALSVQFFPLTDRKQSEENDGNRE